MQAAANVHESAGNHEWRDAATQELIALLRDDYPTLMSVLSALGDSIIN